MPANRAILLWVEEIAFSERRQATVFCGFDFAEGMPRRSPDVPEELFAIRRGEVVALPRVNVCSVHRLNKGRAWETSTPEAFPRPPFLLTDDPRYRLIYDGPVEVEPTPEEQGFILGEFHHFGRYSTDLTGEGWFGVLSIVPASPATGHLWAYSRERLQLPAGELEVMSDPDEAFGRIRLP